MEAFRTWRELLGRVIIDPQERQRVAEEVGVNPITLIRWAANRSNPRPDNLQPLCEALPQYQRQMIMLLREEFPRFVFQDDEAESIEPEIDSAFYARVINMHTTSPARLRAPAMRQVILQQLAAQLDPQQQGIIVISAQCVPPRKGRKVRSLRTMLVRGTQVWGKQTENRTHFFGTESQIGQTLMTGQAMIVDTPEMQERFACGAPFGYSVVTYPILQADRIAGCLGVASESAHYFTQERLDLIQAYLYLLILAFEPEEFYSAQEIELGVMPPDQVQQGVIATFQARVTRHLIEGGQRGETPGRSEAELQVWREIEEELLAIEDASPDDGKSLHEA